MYDYLARRYLRDNSSTTKFELQSYPADRLEKGISPALVSNERKALPACSHFSTARDYGISNIELAMLVVPKNTSISTNMGLFQLLPVSMIYLNIIR